jgi:choline-sulfatase
LRVTPEGGSSGRREGGRRAGSQVASLTPWSLDSGTMRARVRSAVAGRLARWSIVAVLPAVIVATGACHSAPPDAAPNVVLVTLDTTRADHLGCYGDGEASTPHIDAVAAGGARFDTAITPVPITLPSHTTILTGRSPASHGVHDNVLDRLPDGVPTLAVLLGRRGYDTAAFIGAAVLDHRFGLARGFDRYDDDLIAGMKERNPLSFVERRAENVTRPAVEWLAAHGTERPFLLWAHYFDPHMDYAAPAPFGERFAERPYDGEIAYVDHWVGDLLDAVARHENGRPTLVVVVGDHGEGLGEHGEQTHGLFLYDSTLRVPLLMRFPDRIPAGVVVPDLVSTVAILPTILDLVGVPAPDGLGAGSLVPLLHGSPATDAKPIFLETLLPKNLFGWTPIEGIRTARFKYVESPKPELYDLESDPKETVNLVEQRGDEVASLRDRLARHRTAAAETRRGGGSPRQLDEATRQRLAALGYAVAPEPVAVKGHMDAKDLVTLFDAVYGAAELIAEHQWDKAIDKLRSVLKVHPKHVGAMVMLGDVHWRRAYEGAVIVSGAPTQSSVSGEGLLPLAMPENAPEDLAEAESWYRRALEIDPSSGPAELGLGRVYGSRGELDAALECYRRALEISPEAPEARSEMATILIRQGQLAKAVDELEHLVRVHPDYAPAHRSLGALYRGRGDDERALQEYRLAARLAPNDSGAHFLLAKLLAAKGRFDEALPAYRTALRLDPNAVHARIGLGDLYFRQGELAAAREQFEIAARLSPKFADAYFALGTLDAREGKLDSAARNYRAALQCQPGLAVAEGRLAQIYRRQGKNDLAEKALQRARQLAPDSARVREMLADLYRATGRADEARRLLAPGG